MSEYPSAEDELKTMTRRLWDQVEVTEKAFAEIAQLKAEAARLRKALRYIASRPTDQLAAPQQCSMVAVAMEALAAVREPVALWDAEKRCYRSDVCHNCHGTGRVQGCDPRASVRCPDCNGHGLAAVRGEQKEEAK